MKAKGKRNLPACPGTLSSNYRLCRGQAAGIDKVGKASEAAPRRMTTVTRSESWLTS